jgi:oligopeptide transport system substrate-binding protein
VKQLRRAPGPRMFWLVPVPMLLSMIRLALGSLLLLLLGCTNNPYPRSDWGTKVLYRSFAEAPKTLDPAVAYTTSAHAITGLVNGTLLEYHYLKRPYTLIAGLAKQVPSAVVEGDGKVRYRFELYPDLRYQDDACFEAFNAGRSTRQVVAQDVAFELMRIADPAVNSPALEPFSHVVDFVEFRQRLTQLRKQDPGVNQLSAREQYQRAGGIAGALVRSSTLLDIVLKEAYPQLLYWFAMPFTTPLPWEAVHYYDGQQARDHLADHPVGTGPYRVTRYDKQSLIVLEKNDNWHGIRHPEWQAPGTRFPTNVPQADIEQGLLSPEAPRKPLPCIERVEFRREKEDIPAFGKFLQGYYDASGIIKESFDTVVRNDLLSPEMRARGMHLTKTVEPTIFYLGFNMDDPVVGGPSGLRGRKLRQAMSLAVDAGEFKRIFLNGRGIPAQSPLPPGIFGYDPEYANPYRTVDLQRAQQLLGEAAYPQGVDPKTGKPLRLTFDTGDTSAEGQLRYTFYINAWRKIGLDVELKATNYNRFQEKMRDGAFQIFSWGWVADYPDPENFLFLLWSKMSRKRSNGPNTANFADPRYDELFLKMKSISNTPERLGLIREMRELLQEQCPWIPMLHSELYTLRHGWLSNVKPMGMSVPLVKYYDLDPRQRAELRREWNRPILWPVYLLAGLFVVLVLPGIRTFLKERQ